MSVPPIAQPFSQSTAIMRTADGRIEHLATDSIGSVPGVQPFGRAPGAFPGAPQVEEEERNG